MITHLEAETLLHGATADLPDDLRQLADLLAVARETTTTGPVTPGSELHALFSATPRPGELAGPTRAPWRAPRSDRLGIGLKTALATAAVAAVLVVAHQLGNDQSRGHLDRPASTVTSDPTPAPPSEGPTKSLRPERTSDAPPRRRTDVAGAGSTGDDGEPSAPLGGQGTGHADHAGGTGTSGSTHPATQDPTDLPASGTPETETPESPEAADPSGSPGSSEATEGPTSSETELLETENRSGSEGLSGSGDDGRVDAGG